jgi:hypothetical protein
MAIRVGMTGPIESGALLWTVPNNILVTGKLLANTDHFIEAELCHLKYESKEYVWAFTDEKEDPCHLLKIQPRFSLIVPVLIKNGESKVHKNIRFPKSFSTALFGLEKNGKTAGMIVEISRFDSGGYSKYAIIDTTKKAPIDFNQDEWVEQILARIKIGTPKEIKDWLQEIGVPFDGTFNGGWKTDFSKDETKW